MNVSRHCQTRMQQRAIPSWIADLLLDFGSRMRRDGAEVVFADRAARRQIRRAVGGARNMRTIEPWLDAYLVVADDGALITAARRTRRLRRAQHTQAVYRTRASPVPGGNKFSRTTQPITGHDCHAHHFPPALQRIITVLDFERSAPR